MILPERVLEGWGELDQIGCCDRPDFLADPIAKLSPQRFVRIDAGHQRHINIDALPLQAVRVADAGRLGHFRMGD